jgi:hypothetical protein
LAGRGPLSEQRSQSPQPATHRLSTRPGARGRSGQPNEQPATPIQPRKARAVLDGGRDVHKSRSRANAIRALSRNRVSRPHSSHGEPAGTGTSETTRSLSTLYISAGDGADVTCPFHAKEPSLGECCLARQGTVLGHSIGARDAFATDEREASGWVRDPARAELLLWNAALRRQLPQRAMTNAADSISCLRRVRAVGRRSVPRALRRPAPARHCRAAGASCPAARGRPGRRRAARSRQASRRSGHGPAAM